MINPRTISQCVACFFFLFFFNCTSKEKNLVRSELDRLLSKELLLIDSLEVYYPSKNIGEMTINPKYKIVAYIDGNCDNCIGQLKVWKHFIEKYNNYSVQFCFYVSSINSDYIKSILENIEFNYYVSIDKNDTFYQCNELVDNKLFQVFLLDENGKTIVVGNPIFSNKLEEMFFKIIAFN